MRIREATYSDIDTIEALYRAARDYFADAGIDQWQVGGPDAETAFADVEDGILYVVVDEVGAVEGVFACDFAGEPVYDRITGGAWLSDGEYAALHRVAVAPACKGRGIAGEMVAFAQARCRESGVEALRADTHAQNRSMRRMLEKNGFVFCGTVRYPVDGDRVCYEKILEKE